MDSNGSPEEAIKAAKSEILDVMNEEPRLVAKFVRLSFHDCVGGCDGCVDMNNTNNAGLNDPIDALLRTFLFYEAQLTLADVWALAGMVAAEGMQQGGRVEYSFDYYGRETCDNMRGEPDIKMTSYHIVTEDLLDFFALKFGFGTRESVAVMGAHTLLFWRRGMPKTVVILKS